MDVDPDSGIKQDAPMLTLHDIFHERPASPSTPQTSPVESISPRHRRRRPAFPLDAQIIALDPSYLPAVRSAPGGRVRHLIVQTGRHRPGAGSSSTPYDRPDRQTRSAGSSGAGPSLIARMSGQAGGRKPIELMSKRLPAGTPIILAESRIEHQENIHKQKSRLNAILSSDEMKQWIRSKMIAPGVLDLSALPDDQWLKQQGLVPPSHPDAPHNAGAVFWAVIDKILQKSDNVQIHTLSLARNNFRHLHQLEKLALYLPQVRALDLSSNPITSVKELSNLLGSGKNLTASGTLKGLVELKLNDCLFREKLLQEKEGGEHYQSEILKRFPGLLILDGVQLNRIVFPIERKPRINKSKEDFNILRARPFNFPADIQPGFSENEIAKNIVMSFCAKFFPLFDSDRNSLLDGYSPKATISASANTLNSYSLLADDIKATRSTRPAPAAFDKWIDLPARNLIRGKSVRMSTRMLQRTLKSPTDRNDLLNWWKNGIPATKHPLDDATKWNVDAWILDGEGATTRLCAVINGEFEEMPSGTFRSFSRTFILADAPEGSAARMSGWPALVISDTLIAHPYFGTGSFDDTRTLAPPGRGIDIVPLSPFAAVPIVLPVTGDQGQKDALIAQLRQTTGMNVSFSTLCLEQNNWDLEQAFRNYEEIKGTIPAEAYQ